MRRLLFVLMILCEAAWAQDQLPTPVQICSGSTTCAFINNVTSGNLVYVGAHSEGALTTPTDTRSTTWTLVGTQTGSANAYIWCGVLGSSGAETITLTGSLSFQGQITAEFPAFAGLSCTKDGSAVTGTPPSGNLTTSALTTTNNGEMMLCYVSSSSSGQGMVPHNGGAFLSITGQNGADAGAFAYRFSGTNGSYTCGFDSTNSNGAYVLVAFSPNPTMVTKSLPTASLTNSYSYTPQCVGGVGAYTWTASSLPTGLSINSSTGAITGTPTGGTTTPTITCTGATSGAASLTTAALTVNSSTGTPAIVGTPCGATATPANCSLGTVTSGNCLVVAGWAGNGALFANPTDSLSTTFRYIGQQKTVASVLLGVPLWVGRATSTGTDTVTLSTGIASIAAAQISNCQSGFSDVAVSNAGQNAGSVTISGASLTTLAPASEIWSVIVGWSSGTTWTAGTGFSVAGGSGASTGPIQAVAANESATGSYTPSFVQTGNADGHWAIWGIALRPSTSGVVNTNHRRAWVISQ